MWIAKPLHALSESEKRAWASVPKPLAQTLAWACALEKVSGPAYLVMDPEERVGGIVFAIPHEGGLRFECVNGPLLHWDHPQSVPRQIATFAMAVSKLDRQFRSLVVRPRWRQGEMEKRLPLLPLEPASHSRAATLQIPVEATPLEQARLMSPRLRRTLAVTGRESPAIAWQTPDRGAIETFHPGMAAFAQAKGFVVPPLQWFHALIENAAGGPERIEFKLGSASIGDRLLTQLLICRISHEALYLFGYERRAQQLRSAISGAAALHASALDLCRAIGARIYDLNGYIDQVESGHPYAGVCRFKEQFGGGKVLYEVPEFVIS